MLICDFVENYWGWHALYLVQLVVKKHINNLDFNRIFIFMENARFVILVCFYNDLTIYIKPFLFLNLKFIYFWAVAASRIWLTLIFNLLLVRILVKLTFTKWFLLGQINYFLRTNLLREHQLRRLFKHFDLIFLDLIIDTGSWWLVWDHHWAVVYVRVVVVTTGKSSFWQQIKFVDGLHISRQTVLILIVLVVRAAWFVVHIVLLIWIHI